MLGMSKRWEERYGKYRISTLVGSYAYSTPRNTEWELPSQYAAVEIGLFHDDHVGLVHPSNVGLDDFDDEWEPGNSPVAGYVAHERWVEFRKAVAAKAGCELVEPTRVD